MHTHRYIHTYKCVRTDIHTYLYLYKHHTNSSPKLLEESNPDLRVHIFDESSPDFHPLAAKAVYGYDHFYKFEVMHVDNFCMLSPEESFYLRLMMKEQVHEYYQFLQK